MGIALHKINHYRGILALPVLGIFALFLSGGEVGSFTANKVKSNWTLANNENVQEESVDWSLAKTEPQDTNEDETDWTLAKNDRSEEEEVDWTLA